MQAAIERMKREAVSDIASNVLILPHQGGRDQAPPRRWSGRGRHLRCALCFPFLNCARDSGYVRNDGCLQHSESCYCVTASSASVLQEPKAQPSQQSAIGKEEKPSNVVALVSSNPPAVSIIEFATNALVRKLGAMNESDDFYLAHWRHCKAVDGRDMAPTEAVRQRTTLRRMR